MQDNQLMINSLTRQRDELDNMIKNYKTIPQNSINNVYTTQISDNSYEMRRLLDTDEIENIAVFKNTIFMNEDQMQIKKMDGTIEKYEITRVYPKDKRDLIIEELKNRIAELERGMKDESTKSIESAKESNESRSNVAGDAESKSETTSKTITRVK